MGRLFYFYKKEEVIMRRISYIITSLIMVFSMATITAFAKPDWPIDTGIQSEAGIVMDMDSGAVLFAQNINLHGNSIQGCVTFGILLRHIP